MAINYTYPLKEIPTVSDSLLIIDNEDTVNPQSTKTVTVQSIVNLASGGGGGGVTDFTSTAGTFVSVTANSAATGSVSIGTVDLSATGTPDATTFLRGDNTWSTIPAGTFLDLTDTPATYAGSGGFFAVVNAGETAIEFTENPAAGYIDIGYIAFDVAVSPEPSSIGNMWWSSDFETPYIQLDAGFKMRVGQDHVIRCKADTGVNIVTGDVVKFVDATGDTPIVGLADGSSDEPYTLVGIAVEDIASEEFGFVMQFGGVMMNTADPGWTLGQLLYVDPLNPGKLTNSIPSPPNWTFPIAAVTRVGSGSSGRILVRAIPGLHLHDVIDVRISGISDNDILQYDTGTGLWMNTPGGDITESTSSVLTITGGTNAVLGSGTTIEVAQASSLNNGYLTSSDWIIFNSKLTGLVNDASPTLGGNLDVGNGTYSIISELGSNANINITPDGTGAVVLDGLSYPTADGSPGDILTTNGSGVISFTTPATGTVTSVSGTGTAGGLTLTGTVTSSGSLTLGGSLDISTDASPQLGGTLDANAQNITTVKKIDAAQFQALTNALTAGTILWNTANGTYAEVKLTTNSTLQIGNLEVGTPAVLKVEQDSTTPGFNITAYTVSGGTVKWPGGSVPTITAAVNSIDIITFISDGTDIYASIVQDLK